MPLDSIPVVGLGTWKATNSEHLKQAIKIAAKTGYRHFDCAPVYLNEKIVGEALSEVYTEGITDRDSIWLTSKLWNTCHDPKNVREHCLQTIEDLHPDQNDGYLDLYLIHWPHAFEDTDDPRSRDPEKLFPKNEDGTVRYSDTSFIQTWSAMEALVEEGLVRNIGLSNFNETQVYQIMAHCKIPPMVIQCESNPRLSNKDLFWYCMKQEIVCSAYCPLAGGNNNVLMCPIVLELAEKYSRTPAQIVLRWQLDRGVTVIPKSVTESRIIENFNIQTWKLHKNDVQKLYSLETGERCVGLERDRCHPDFPFK